MAATITLEDQGGGKPSAPLFVSEINVVGDSSYPTGGYPVGAEDLIPEGATVIGALCEDLDATGFVFHYDRSNDKLMAFTSNGAAPAALAELPNTNGSLDTKNIRIILLSK